MKILFISFCFLFFHFQEDLQRMVWAENRKLSWQDFQGSPPTSSQFAASTATGINFEYSYSTHNNNVEVEYIVESFFLRAKSWYIPNKINKHILNHEQTHFDISELHARILRKRLSTKRFTTNIKIEIETLYIEAEEQRKAMQLQFDLETNHSQNLEKEIQWEKRIAKKLQEYEPWK